MSIDTPLHRLLVKAGIAGSDYWRHLWFDGVRLERNLLLCPNAETAASIDRMFLPSLRLALSDIQIRIESQPNRPLKSQWRIGDPKYKPTVYTGKSNEPEPGDLL